MPLINTLFDLAKTVEQSLPSLEEESDFNYPIFRKTCDKVVAILWDSHRAQLDSIASELLKNPLVDQNRSTQSNIIDSTFYMSSAAPIALWLLETRPPRTSNALEDRLKRMIELWSSDEFLLTVFAAITGIHEFFLVHPSPKDLGLGWSISERDDVKSMCKDSKATFGTTGHYGRTIDCDMVLEKTISLKKKENIDLLEQFDELTQIICSLRIIGLRQSGCAGIVAMCPKSHVPIQPYNQWIIGSPSLCPSGTSAGSFLDDALYQEFASTLQGIVRIMPDCRLGIRRLTQVASRRDFSDMVADLAIALESILLADVDSELSYRMRLRGSQIGTIPMSRSATFQSLKEMYATRSAIVHGSNSLDKTIRSLKPSPTHRLHEWYKLVLDITKHIAKHAEAEDIGAREVLRHIDTQLIGD